jgi:hypothetical protein
MLNILPVLTLVLIGTAAQSDSVVPKGQGTAPHGTQMRGMFTAACAGSPQCRRLRLDLALRGHVKRPARSDELRAHAVGSERNS